MNQCLSVIMPVYNEEKTVAKVVDAVLKQPCVKEIIITDDCSTDRSRDILQLLASQDSRIRLFKHPVNQGKGAAIRTGIAAATAPLVILQDSDMEYSPEEYMNLINPILTGRADVVYGSRFGIGSHRVLYYWHSVGNKFLTMLSNMCTDINFTDMECCYKIFRREVIQNILIEEKGFGFEPEITAKLAKLNLSIYEVSIAHYGRTYAEGKKRGWKDRVQALYCVIKYNLFR